MTRGNQRELSRVKNMKKQQGLEKSKKAENKSGNKGLTLEERRHRDAEIMRQKQIAKTQAAEGATGGAASK